MKIARWIPQERIASVEERRKIMQRKEAGEAYRKHAKYFYPKKNPILEELENLLLGRKDRDLYEKQKDETNELSSNEYGTVHDLQSKEENAHSQAPIYQTITEEVIESTPSEAKPAEDMLHILEKVKSAALAPTNPSPQDLRVAASAHVQIQQVQAQLNGTALEEIVDEEPAFIHEPVEVKVPERFLKELKLDPFTDTIFGKRYEEAYKASMFKNASAKYRAHFEMAKNGYRMGYESTLSWTA